MLLTFSIGPSFIIWVISKIPCFPKNNVVFRNSVFSKNSVFHQKIRVFPYNTEFSNDMGELLSKEMTL